MGGGRVGSTAIRPRWGTSGPGPSRAGTADPDLAEALRQADPCLRRNGEVTHALDRTTATQWAVKRISPAICRRKCPYRVAESAPDR